MAERSHKRKQRDMLLRILATKPASKLREVLTKRHERLTYLNLALRNNHIPSATQAMLGTQSMTLATV